MSTPTKIRLPRAFRDLFKPARYKAYYGGRGSGKSHAFATALLLQGLQKPLRILCAREVQTSIKDSVKHLLDDKIAALRLTAFYESVQTELRGRNGTRFVFAGLGQMSTDQIKSMEGIDRAWVEEAQTISDRSLETLIPTIRSPGSELWFTWNPRHAVDPVDKRFRGPAVPPDSLIRKVTFEDNPFFPDTLEKERLFDLDHNRDRYGHIWLGDYEPTAIGAIWDRATLHQHRRDGPPVMARILVSVDPAVTSAASANEHGIIVGGLGEDGRGYVLEDASLTGTPRDWANRAVAMVDKWEADAVVIETNQGGDMVRHTLQSVRPGVPVVEVRATRGKHVRAEPISALYSLGRISHVGTFPKLEDQMCRMTAAGYEGEGSPDRCDALVWLLTQLFPSLVKKKQKARPGRPRTEPVEGGWMG